MLSVPEYEALRSAVRRQSKHAQMVVLHIEKDIAWQGDWLSVPLRGMRQDVLPNYRRHFCQMPEFPEMVASMAWSLVQPRRKERSLPVFCATYDGLYQRYCVDIPQKEPERQIALRHAQYHEEVRAQRRALADTPPTIRHDTPGMVYLLQAEGTCYVKIGYTMSPDVRLDTLKTASPFPLRVLRIIPSPAPRALERTLHRRYRAMRHHGEWFALAGETLADLLHEEFTE